MLDGYGYKPDPDRLHCLENAKYQTTATRKGKLVSYIHAKNFQ